MIARRAISHPVIAMLVMIPAICVESAQPQHPRRDNNVVLDVKPVGASRLRRPEPDDSRGSFGAGHKGSQCRKFSIKKIFGAILPGKQFIDKENGWWYRIKVLLFIGAIICLSIAAGNTGSMYPENGLDAYSPSILKAVPFAIGLVLGVVGLALHCRNFGEAFRYTSEEQLKGKHKRNDVADSILEITIFLLFACIAGCEAGTSPQLFFVSVFATLVVVKGLRQFHLAYGFQDANGHEPSFSNLAGEKIKERLRNGPWWTRLRYAAVFITMVFVGMSIWTSGSGGTIPLWILLPTIVLPPILLGLNMWDVHKSNTQTYVKTIPMDVAILTCVMLLAFLSGWTHKIWLLGLCSSLLVIKSFKLMINVERLAPLSDAVLARSRSVARFEDDDQKFSELGDQNSQPNPERAAHLHAIERAQALSARNDAFQALVEKFTRNGTGAEITELKKSVRKNRARSIKSGTTYPGVPERIGACKYSNGTVKSGRYYILPDSQEDAVACDYRVYKEFFGEDGKYDKMTSSEIDSAD